MSWEILNLVVPFASVTLAVVSTNYFNNKQFEKQRKHEKEEERKKTSREKREELYRLLYKINTITLVELSDLVKEVKAYKSDLGSKPKEDKFKHITTEVFYIICELNLMSLVYLPEFSENITNIANQIYNIYSKLLDSDLIKDKKFENDEDKSVAYDESYKKIVEQINDCAIDVDPLEGKILESIRKIINE